MYDLYETPESMEDISGLASYMIKEFMNDKAALDFLSNYSDKIEGLKTFPFGYKGISFEHRGYEIRLKPYDTYNIFFIVDTKKEEIVILRVLKSLQNWKTIMSVYDDAQKIAEEKLEYKLESK
jgi:plasmid stabilization system protein ParE